LIQKKAHMIEQASSTKHAQCLGLLMSPTWLLGLLLMVIMPLPIDFIAYSYASQSLLAPTASVTIAANQVLAPLFLDETLSRGELVATVVIIVGVLLSTLTGSHAEQQYTVCSLLDLYGESTFYVPASLLSVAIAAAYYYRDDREVLGKARPATIAFLAGGFGALNNLFFKAAGELAFSSDDSHWGTIHPYYHVALVALLATMQISHVNVGIKEYEAVNFLPLYNCFFIVCTSTLGGIFFGELAEFNVLQWILFPFSVATTLVGIVIMSNASKSRPKVGLASLGETMEEVKEVSVTDNPL
jgi:drug/metabolite transporter (DMT)-like permease